MQEEIKEIIGLNCEEEIEIKYFAKDDSLAYKTMDYSELLDYITNLQEELEEEKRIEKESLKTIQNLEEDNKQLKELCDKYEEEHSTTFEYWKRLVKEDYKSRNEKVIEYIEHSLKDNFNDDIHNFDLIKILNILQGVDKE